MRRSLQEEVFFNEVSKRIEHLSEELTLDHCFVVGALELILFDIKQQYFEAEDEDEM